MLRRNLVWSLLAFASLMLFGGAEAGAVAKCPKLECQDLAPDGFLIYPPVCCEVETVSNANYRVRLTGLPTKVDSPGLYTCSTYPCYVWEYTIEAADGKDSLFSKFKKMAFYLPLLRYDDDLAVVGGSGAWKYEELCSGSGTFDVAGFGNGICNGRVVTVYAEKRNGDPQGTKRAWFAVNTTTDQGLISAAFTSPLGNLIIGSCMSHDAEEVPNLIGGIAGPAPRFSKYAPSEVEKTLHPGGGCVIAVYNSLTGCIKKFFTCPPEPKEEILPTGKPSFISANLVDLGNFESGQCREATFATENSPVQYWAYVNGYYYCLGEYSTKCGTWLPCNTTAPSCQ